MFQWLLFGGAALVWMTFCGTNLLLLFSHREHPSLLPFVGALAGACAALLVPETMVLSHRLALAGLLFSLDPFWLAPLLQTRTWLQRR